MLHAFASCLLTPAIAALTLTLCGHDAFSERLGINGAMPHSATRLPPRLFGAIAYYAVEGAVFIVTAALIVAGLPR